MRISYQTSSADDEPDLLARLRAGDRRVIDKVYRTYADAFIVWARRGHPKLTEEHLEDAYYEAVICLLENIASGRLTQLTSSLQTYLFAIGERFCQKVEKSYTKTINVSALFDTKGKYGSNMAYETPSNLPELIEDPFGLAVLSDEEQEIRDRLMTGLKRLTADCRELLIGFYYQNLSVSELSEEFNHRDNAVTRTRKSQCLSRLRELLRH